MAESKWTVTLPLKGGSTEAYVVEAFWVLGYRVLVTHSQAMCFSEGLWAEKFRVSACRGQLVAHGVKP